MSVVAGNGTKEFNLPLLHPRLVARTVSHALPDKIKHDIEAGVAHNDNVFILDLEHLGENRLAFGDSVKNTVVSAFKSR